MKFKRSLVALAFAFAFAFVFVAANAEAATVKVPLYRYKCKVCGKEFYSFKGDALDDKKYAGNEQRKYVRRLSDKDKTLEDCKTSNKAHEFQGGRNGEVSWTMPEIYSKRSSIAVIKDSSNTISGTKLYNWECYICKKRYYSLDSDLNIEHWDRQRDKIFSLRNQQAIDNCKSGYYGHVFKKLNETSAKSWAIAQNIDKLYYIKP